MSRFTNPVPQFYLNDGSIASSGKLFFYENGTTTKKDTWNAPDGAPGRAKNTNPVVLDGNGRCPNIFGEGRYTVVFVSSDDTGNVQQWTRDYVELSVQLGQYSDWSPILTYRINDIVRGSDGNYYRSVFNNNTGSDPVSSASRWERIGFITYWNTNATYGNGDLVVFGDALYRSGEDENQGNQPDQSSTTVWKNTVEPSPWRSGISYQSGELAIYDAAIYRSSANDNQGNQPDASNQWDNVFGEFPLVELAGGTTTLTSNFNGTYWWDGAGGHAITIGEQAGDEGATVTRLICRSDSGSNLTLDLASGVTANWSFDESESADGYEIKPGEIVELVKVGTNSYVAYAPNGISERITMGGGFTSGEAVITRRGIDVTITAVTPWNHSSASFVESAAMPSIFWPVRGAGSTTIGPANMTSWSATGAQAFQLVSVTHGGIVQLRYIDGSFSTVNRTSSTGRVTITYAIRD